ncbi:ketosteroid isomerase [Halobacteriales archaeon QH_10_67_13]|nr:MAG: ketosteroid isomerase [Halobacteriales archaeon QH_10_67_13]
MASDSDAVDPEATAREYYETVDAGDYERLVELFAEDVRYDRPGQGVLEGRDRLLTFYREERPLENGSHEVHDVLVDGDRVAVRGRFTGELDGDRVAFGFADFHEFEDGLIARRYTFTDRDAV